MGRDKAIACYRELGAEMRKRREEAGLTIRDLSRQIGCSTTTLWRIENGRHNLHPEDVIYYLGLCGIYPCAARDLVALCREAERNLGYWLTPHGQWLPDSLGSLIHHESTALAVTWYDPIVVNGLLQTADYARALIGRETWRSLEDVDTCVEIRLERQEILHWPRREFTFLLHEDVLDRRIVNSAAMHEQLLKIVLLAALENVTVRIVPAQEAFGGQFCLFQFKEHAPLVYLENQSSAQFLEDKDYVDPFRDLVSTIADVALDGGQSRKYIAALASEYDRGSTPHGEVEEEQL